MTFDWKREAKRQRRCNLDSHAAWENANAQREQAWAERDAALAQVAYLQQEYDEAHNVIEAGLERESAALARVEALRKPLEFPWPEAPERLMEFLALRNAALAAIEEAGRG